MSRYHVKIGKEFEIDAVDIDPKVDLAAAIRAKTKQDEAATRAGVARYVLVAIGFALAVSAAMRLVDGNFGAFSAVWSAASLPLGWVLRSYFEEKD